MGKRKKKSQLQNLRRDKGVTQRAVADSLGVSLTSYNNWERGIKAPSDENIEKLAVFFDVSTARLRGTDAGEGLLLANYNELNPIRQKKLITFSEKQMKEQNQRIFSLREVIDYNTVKVYEGLSAGPGFGLSGDGSYDEVQTSEELPSFDIATWVRGDSMSPQFLDWSVALVKETGFDYDGAIYAVYVEASNTTYIKKVYVEKDGLRLESINKKYPDRFVSVDDNPMIIGKIVGNFVPAD